MSFTAGELLTMAERALDRLDWGQVYALASDALSLEPDNTEAAVLRDLAERRGGRNAPPGRRQATALFADLVGSTPLAERYDVEIYSGVLRAFEHACRPAIDQHEGHFVDLKGDALVACFGYPSAHEDDACRAVQAALDMLAALRPVAAELKAEQGIELAARIGIDTGLVVIDGAGVRGATLNRAARLQALATPGTAVVSATTNELVADQFETEPLGKRKLKGVEDPVEVFQVLGPRDRVRYQRVLQPPSGPFIGRDAELQQVLELWETTVAAHRAGGLGEAPSGGAMVLISGDPGIGKSRLTAVVAERTAEAGMQRIELQCSSDLLVHDRVAAAGGGADRLGRHRSAGGHDPLRLLPGAAFQIRDDLLNLVGCEDRYGKELLGDLREGKRTLMLIHLLAAVSPDERRALVAYLAAAAGHPVAGNGGPAAGLDAAAVLELMVRHGSLEFAFQFGQGVAAAAYDAFAQAFADVPPSPHRDFVEAMVPYMLERSV